MTLFIDFRLTLGVLLGYGGSFLNIKIIEHRYKHLEDVNVFTYLGIYISISALVIPILIGVLLPRYFSWLGVLIGLLLNKVSLIIDAVRNKG